jgi:hypothetical protein
MMMTTTMMKVTEKTYNNQTLTILMKANKEMEEEEEVVVVAVMVILSTRGTRKRTTSSKGVKGSSICIEQRYCGIIGLYPYKDALLLDIGGNAVAYHPRHLENAISMLWDFLRDGSTRLWH